MKTTSLRTLVLAVLLVGAASLAAFALPGFSDRNINAGNLNSADKIMVQEIRITRSSSETVTISSITVQNLGTAGDGEIDEIIISISTARGKALKEIIDVCEKTGKKTKIIKE